MFLAELNSHSNGSCHEREQRKQEIEKLKQFKDSLMKSIRLNQPGAIRSESKLSHLTSVLHSSKKHQRLPQKNTEG